MHQTLDRELAEARKCANVCVVTTVEEIRSAIHALLPNERAKLIEELPAMLPELDGDAAWEGIIRDARPRSSLSSYQAHRSTGNGIPQHP